MAHDNFYENILHAGSRMEKYHGIIQLTDSQHVKEIDRIGSMMYRNLIWIIECFLCALYRKIIL